MDVDLLHVTLAVLEHHADFPAPVFEKLVKVGDSLSAPPMTVTLDRIVGTLQSAALRPRRPLFPLNHLHRLLAAGVARAGPRILRRSAFNAHLMLFYRNGPLLHWDIEPIEWRATELILVDSLLGKDRHVEIARWPLSGDWAAMPHARHEQSGRDQYALPL